MPPTRRERVRRDTTREITTTALAHLREHGAADLSVRAIARDIGMSPAGMYRYFDGRDALLTHLIVDGYNDLADHVLAATGASDDISDRETPPKPPARVAADAAPADRFRAAVRAYRAWALGHPHEFSLLFGDPVPGYSAPESGETTAANTRLGAALGRPIIELALTGDLVPLRHSDDTAVSSAMGPLQQLVPEHAGAAAAATMLLAWTRVHGVVTLELNGQFRFLFGDDAAPLFEATVEAMVEELGFVAPGRARARPRRKSRLTFG